MAIAFHQVNRRYMRLRTLQGLGTARGSGFIWPAEVEELQWLNSKAIQTGAAEQERMDTLAGQVRWKLMRTKEV